MNESLQKILEYDLFKVADYSFAVYDLLKVAMFFLIAKLALWSIKKLISRHSKARKFDQGSTFALYQIARYLIWVIIAVLALEAIGVKVTILIAGSAALLVGIGLGLQQTFNDIVSGIILLIEGSIKVGHVLEVEDDVVTVKRIGLRTSIVEDRNEITIILPNSKIVTDKVVNWSYNYERTRFQIKVGVAYESDVDKVFKILGEAAAEHPSCDKAKPPFARLVDFGDSSLDFEIHFWSNDAFGIEQVKSDIRRNVAVKFKEHNITIPFPQRDLHVKYSPLSDPNA